MSIETHASFNIEGDLPPHVKIEAEGVLANLRQTRRITADQATDLAAVVSATGKSIFMALAARAILTGSELHEYMAEFRNWAYADLSEATNDEETLGSISPDDARRLEVVPVRTQGHNVIIAMRNPGDMGKRREINDAILNDKRPVFAYAPPKLIKKRLEEVYSATRQAQSIRTEAAKLSNSKTVALSSESISGDLGTARAEKGDIEELVELLIEQAFSWRATNILFEPTVHGLNVRARVDTKYRHMITRPLSEALQIIARIKNMSGMRVDMKLSHQGGSFAITVGGKTIDVRVAMMPATLVDSDSNDQYEGVSLRLLPRNSRVPKLEEMGFAPDNYARFRESFARSKGLILVTGPTGSGKSTTLYSTLGELMSTEKNTVTVEDPVERNIEGATQIQVNEAQDVTFASTMRAFLRHDPDYILVGEIRDNETAEMAIKAAMAGHLVLSTLHTNDAAGVMIRLLGMGVEPYLVSTLLNGVVAQRLVPKLCDRCKTPLTVTEAELLARGFEYEGEDVTVYTASGRIVTEHGSRECDDCGGTGHLGQIAVHEVLTIDEGMAELIADRAKERDIRDYARRAGMPSMLADGLEKAKQGLCSLEEVFSAVR